jgi:NADPH-dependent curcumin reductase CurA
MSPVNRQIRLKSRPTRMIEPANFELVTAPVPTPREGEVLIRVLYVSIDPAMRGWLRPHRTYVDPVQVGDVMRAITLGRVIESKNGRFAPGTYVTGLQGIQDYALSDGRDLHEADPRLAPLPAWLGPLGMPGLTAYFGLLDVGRAKPGETVLVSAASGAVGSIVGQIAKLMGCRVVGIAGSEAKCAYITDELGMDAALNYKTSRDLAADIKAACPHGVNLYFDNVGGPILDAALACLAQYARIVVCGMISQYNVAGAEEAYGVKNTIALLRNRARMEGFIVFDYRDRYAEAYPRLAEWLKSGRLKHREDILDGIENAPEAMRRLFTGENFGKMVLKIAEPE